MNQLTKALVGMVRMVWQDHDGKPMASELFIHEDELCVYYDGTIYTVTDEHTFPIDQHHFDMALTMGCYPLIAKHPDGDLGGRCVEFVPPLGKLRVNRNGYGFFFPSEVVQQLIEEFGDEA